MFLKPRSVGVLAVPCRGDTLDGFPCEPVQGSTNSFQVSCCRIDLHGDWRPWWKTVAHLISPELLGTRLPRKQIQCVVIAYSKMFCTEEAGLPKGWDFCS